jgi:hypothetical protein
VPCEEKCNEVKDSYEELGHVFCHFPGYWYYNMKILLGDFNAKVDREDTVKLTAGNENSHKISMIMKFV